MAHTIKKTQTTDKNLFDLIQNLRKLSNKTGVSLYRAVAFELSRSASQRCKVNVSKLNKLCKNKDTIIIPGTVLGDGLIEKSLTVIGFKATFGAIEKIEKAKGTFIKIEDFIKGDLKVKPRIMK